MTPEERADQILGDIFPMAITLFGMKWGQFLADDKMRTRVVAHLTAAVTAETQRCVDVARSHGKGCPSCSGGIWRECPDLIANEIEHPTE